jgi:hypothetical protein
MKTATVETDDDGFVRRPGCTCDAPSEYNDPDKPAYDRHLFDCALAPDITDDWLWYPHDGELESGGVYVNPTDRSCLYLVVKEYLCRVPLDETDDDDDDHGDHDDDKADELEENVAA